MSHETLIEVRFRRPGREKAWRYGKLSGFTQMVMRMTPDSLGPESAVDIYDTRTGGVHVINRKYVEKKVRGPKGGVKWESL